MKNMNNLSEQLEDRYIWILFGYWAMINLGITIIIKFFINQQEVIPLKHDGLIGLFPYIFIWLPGVCIVVMLWNRRLPIWMEIACMILMFILSFTISGQPSRYIEHFIRIPDLKALCYRTVSILYNSSQICIILIWYIMRFKKEAPYYMNSQKYVILIFAFIVIEIFSDMLFDILKAIHLFPYII